MSRVSKNSLPLQPGTPPATFPDADEIAARAHELFVSGGRRLTDIPEHWRAAEQELLERAARKALAPSRSARS